MAEVIYRGVRDRHDPNEKTRVETRVEKERADRLALQNQFLRGEVLSVGKVISEMEKGFAAIKAAILRSDLGHSDQDAILRTLSGIKKNALVPDERIKSLFRRGV